MIMMIILNRLMWDLFYCLTLVSYKLLQLCYVCTAFITVITALSLSYAMEFILVGRLSVVTRLVACAFLLGVALPVIQLSSTVLSL